MSSPIKAILVCLLCILSFLAGAALMGMKHPARLEVRNPVLDRRIAEMEVGYAIIGKGKLSEGQWCVTTMILDHDQQHHLIACRDHDLADRLAAAARLAINKESLKAEKVKP